MVWQELDIVAGGVRLHVRRLATAGRPLVLLHGLGVSGAVWQSFARRLAPAWSAIAPDLRGHGRSEHPPSGYEPADYANDIAGLLRALEVDPAPMVGHSLGALVALSMAAATPERVSALVLLDPPLDAARPSPDVEQVARLRHAPAGELESYLVSRAPHAPLLARALAPLYRQAADQAFATLLASARGTPWAWEAAPSIEVPVLLVQADPARDGALGDQAAREFVARLPRGSLLSLAGAAHAVHTSHPTQLAEAVLAFLDGGRAA